MNFLKTDLTGVYIFEPKVFGDHRGFFMESYNSKMFIEEGFPFGFVQDNHSLSIESGTIRGLHYQLPPYSQTKLIRVIRGAIYDVVVDLRKGSSSFGKWQGFILSESNKRQLIVPCGFAHGYCTLVENTEVQYKVDNYYSPEHERGILWNDPLLNIPWPITNPILSEKDKTHPLFNENGDYFNNSNEE